MAYGKLVEGARVWTAANGLADPADINEVQDQISLVQDQYLAPFAMEHDGNWSTIQISDASYDFHATSTLGARIKYSFDIRGGSKIISVGALAEAPAVGGPHNGGYFYLMSRSITKAPTLPANKSTLTDFGGGANPWVSATGSWWVYGTAALTHVISTASPTEVFIQIRAPTSGTGPFRVAGCYITYQLGS